MAAKKHQRTPANVTLRHGHATHRDAIWAAIRQLREFTIDDIEHRVNGERAGAGAQAAPAHPAPAALVRPCTSTRLVSRDTIRTYVQGLTAAGYLQRIKGRQREKSRDTNRYIKNAWALQKDVGIDAPRVTRDGRAVTQGKGREAMWKAMKILKAFNWRELHAHVNTAEQPVSVTEAKSYINILARAGYLRTVEPARPGTPARHRLLPARYTGPKPPQVQRVKQVYDPNLGRVVWPAGGEA